MTATGGSPIYGQSPTNPGFTATGPQNGQGISVLTGLSNSFGITNMSDAGSYTLSIAGTLTNNNYRVTRSDGTWTVNPADVVVTANGGSSVTANGDQSGIGCDGSAERTRASPCSRVCRNSFGVTNMSDAGGYTLSVAGTLTNEQLPRHA